MLRVDSSVPGLNRFGGISQLFKHWEKKHGENPAAKQLVARFKMLLKNKTLSLERLDAAAQSPLRHTAT